MVDFELAGTDPGGPWASYRFRGWQWRAISSAIEFHWLTINSIPPGNDASALMKLIGEVGDIETGPIIPTPSSDILAAAEKIAEVEFLRPLAEQITKSVESTFGIENVRSSLIMGSNLDASIVKSSIDLAIPDDLDKLSEARVDLGAQDTIIIASGVMAGILSKETYREALPILRRAGFPQIADLLENFGRQRVIWFSRFYEIHYESFRWSLASE